MTSMEPKAKARPLQSLGYHEYSHSTYRYQFSRPREEAKPMPRAVVRSESWSIVYTHTVCIGERRRDIHKRQSTRMIHNVIGGSIIAQQLLTCSSKITDSRRPKNLFTFDESECTRACDACRRRCTASASASPTMSMLIFGPSGTMIGVGVGVESLSTTVSMSTSSSPQHGAGGTAEAHEVFTVEDSPTPHLKSSFRDCVEEVLFPTAPPLIGGRSITSGVGRERRRSAGTATAV